MAFQEPRKKRKIQVPQVQNGIPSVTEIEVEDTGGPTWGPKDKHTILNHNIERVDGPAKVSGKAKYTYDVKVPGMLHGYILRPPFPSAEIVRVDTSVAEKMPGVKAVIVLETKEVKHEGQPVAAVAATTPELAEDAVRAIKVEYKQKPHVVAPKIAFRPSSPTVFAQKEGGNLKGNVRRGERRGDKEVVEEEMGKCDAVVEREFYAFFQHHVCLETHGVVVDYRGGDKATVYASTQGTFTVAGDAAKTLGLPHENDVTTIVEYMGGGFGSKFGLDTVGEIACQLSKKAKAPVKLMLTRADEFLGAGNRSGFWIKAKAGASKDGKLKALIAEQYRLGGTDMGSQAGLPYIYKVDRPDRDKPEMVARTVDTIHTHHDGSRAMRAPGHPQASHAMEALMDDLAYEIGMDAVEFRKRNTPDPAYHRQLDRGAKEIGWSAKRNAKPGGGQAYGPYKALKRGVGCGLATWGGGGFPSCKVDVFIQRDGSVAVQVGVQDLGTGSRTLTAAIVAEELGLPVKKVASRIGNSTYGNAVPSGGSVTTGSLSPAVKVAAYNARIQLFQKVAAALGVPAEDLVAQNEKIVSTKDPAKALTWKQACATLGSAGLSARGEWQANLASSGVHGAYFVDLEVDTETGKVRVIKMVGVQDCGLCLNHLASKSQINGGMIQALAYGLYEHHVADSQTGNMLNASLDDYKLPGSMDMPEFVAIIDDGDTREQPIGMAEGNNIPGQSAIANAIYNACGVRITSLPITPDKILMGLQEMKEAKGAGVHVTAEERYVYIPETPEEGTPA